MRAFFLLCLVACVLADRPKADRPKFPRGHRRGVTQTPNEPIPKKVRSGGGAVDCDIATVNTLNHGDIWSMTVGTEEDCYSTFDVADGVEPVVSCAEFDIGENDFDVSVDWETLATYNGNDLEDQNIGGFGAGPYELWVDLYVWDATYGGFLSCEVLGQGSSSGGGSSGGGTSNPPPPPANPTPPSGDCECGLGNGDSAPSGRIVNGQTVGKGELPWQVGLSSPGSDGVFCGGTLIGKKWVMTAAHCTEGSSASRIEVLLGEHDTSSDDGQKRIGVATIHDHPDYDSNTINNDFSILELQEEVTYEAAIRPACLPQDDSKTYDGEMAMVSGWGTLSSGGNQPDELQKLNEVTIYTNADCSQQYNGITDSMICGTRLKDGSVYGDSCQGDSGGPLVYKRGNGRWELIGVVSFGRGCAEDPYPGVYARVTKVLAWIQQTLGGTLPCNA